MTNTVKAEKEYYRHRELLREVVSLDPAKLDPDALKDLQERIQGLLDGTDLRSTRSGFARPEARAQEAERRLAARDAWRAQYGQVLLDLHASGLSYAKIADELTAREIPAPAGGRWAKGSVEFQVKGMKAEQG